MNTQSMFTWWDHTPATQIYNISSASLIKYPYYMCTRWMGMFCYVVQQAISITHPYPSPSLSPAFTISALPWCLPWHHLHVTPPQCSLMQHVAHSLTPYHMYGSYQLITCCWFRLAGSSLALKLCRENWPVWLHNRTTVSRGMRRKRGCPYTKGVIISLFHDCKVIQSRYLKAN